MSGFYFGEDALPQEEVDALILDTAKNIRRFGMITPAIIALESFKPLMIVGGELVRMTILPFLPILNPGIDQYGNKLVHIFEEPGNVEKLLEILEQMSRGEFKEPGQEEAEAEPAEEPSEPTDEQG